MDADHVAVSRLIDNVEQAIQADRPKDEVLRQIDALITGLDIHFRLEEYLFGGVEGAYMRAVQADHERLRGVFWQFREEAETLDSSPLLQALVRIEDSLFQHLIGFDLGFREKMR